MITEENPLRVDNSFHIHIATPFAENREYIKF